MKLNEIVERVYVIGLDHREERRASCRREFQQSGLVDPESIRWFRGISGETCPPPPWFRAGRGAWGCLHSHLRIVQDAMMDGLASYAVFEDDVVFHQRSGELFTRFLSEVPQDWEQLYLGGEHLKEPAQVRHKPFIFRATNTCRTHAYVLKSSAFAPFQRNITDFPEYLKRGPWHLDHQLGLAHERETWKTYCPAWWIAGQGEGTSDIAGCHNPALWWHPGLYSPRLPLLYVPPGSTALREAAYRDKIHFGKSLKRKTLEDARLDQCGGSLPKLKKCLETIAREALHRALLPGIAHARISLEAIREAWGERVLSLEEAKLDEMLDYPFNKLFKHPLNGDRFQPLSHFRHQASAAL